MRTGNTLVDAIIQVAVIAVVAAIVSWIVSAIGAPAIISTVVWIIALAAILIVVVGLARGADIGARHRGPTRRPS